MFFYIIFSFYFPFTLQLQIDIITLVFFFFCNNISTVKTEKLSNKRKTLKFREDFRGLFFTNHDYEKSQR